MTSELINVVGAGPGRLAVLATLFGRAFVDEPMMRWPMGERRGGVERFTRTFSCFLEEVLPLGFVWEAAVANGAAVWIPPGGLDIEEIHPWYQPRIKSLCEDGGARYEEFWGWVDSHTPEEPLWQLDSIAVDPAAQGRGFGAALIRAGLARARADGVGACLSTGTPGNVSIYRRCGFRVVRQADAPYDGPRVWFMRWDP